MAAGSVNANQHDSALLAKVLQFGAEIYDTLNQVLPTHTKIEIEAKSLAQGTILQPQDDIVLFVDSNPTYRFLFKQNCVWNTAKKYLAFRSSTYSIAAVNHSEPVLRFDYILKSKKIPASHINIHSYHPGLIDIMGSAKGSSRGAKAEGKTHKLHIPTGGPRFRPSLEDVLEMLIRELGVDCQEGWLKAIRSGRRNFREKQLAASIFDNPPVAVSTLRELGYEIRWPNPSSKEPPIRTDSLEAF